MKYLLDTHTLLWSLFEPSKLSKKAREAIVNLENVIFVSNISFFEISLKYGIGKLELEKVVPEEIPDAVQQSGFEFLKDSPDVYASFYKLPKVSHSDPFDRMIIWQSIQGGMTVISKDNYIKDYKEHGLKILW